MRILILFFVAVTLISLSSCNTTKPGNAGESTPPDSVKLTVETPSSGPLTGITEDPDRFPYIGVVDDNTLEFQAYTIKFKLTHPTLLAPITSDKLYWLDADNSNEQVGIFVTYVIQGREINLSTPQVRVDYFNKSLPNCSHAEGLFDWWKTTQMVGAGSKVMKEPYTVKTAGGQEAKVMEVLAVKSDSLSPKFLAIAYLEHHDKYMIGMNLTAVDTFEYIDALPAFYDLLESFE